MPNSEKAIGIGVSVRISTSDIRKLQVLALVSNKTAGEIIREAVKKHIQATVNSEEFRAKESSTPPGLRLDTLDKLMGKKSKPARKLTPVHKHKL